MQIRKIPKTDYEALIDFIIPLNTNPDSQCIHTYAGDSAHNLYRSLGFELQYTVSGLRLYLVSPEADTIS